jgi:hypothetical protein
VNAQNLDPIVAAKQAIEALIYIKEPSNTAYVEVAMDAVASALLTVMRGGSVKLREARKVNLGDVLSELVENDLADPIVVTLCDEIETLIKFKDYEGYREEYVSERIASLLSDLKDELDKTIRSLRTKAS